MRCSLPSIMIVLTTLGRLSLALMLPISIRSFYYKPKDNPCKGIFYGRIKFLVVSRPIRSIKL